MYRIGHGDCFLLAFEGPTAAEPRYVLIDCGYKPGSPAYIGNTTVKEIMDDVRTATGGHVHVVVITHEHQDHVNGITAANFDGLTIGESWFAWTEDRNDDVANKLRQKFKDQLLGLLAARQRLAASGDPKKTKVIDDLLSLELGGEDEKLRPRVAAGLLGFNLASDDELLDERTVVRLLGAKGEPGDSLNKLAMKLIKDRSKAGPKFIIPHERVLAVPGAKDLRVFALGPPRDPDQLRLVDPEGEESFGAPATSSGRHFAMAAAAAPDARCAPFAQRFCVPWKEAVNSGDEFFARFYGSDETPPSYVSDTPREYESELNPEWRRIDKDWLYSAEQLALDMNSQTNNSSLVLAFELVRGGKVLLFAADAQRGNWRSWNEQSCTDGKDTITARDLLARAVLYKVGHHGSHNATLKGLEDDDYPNLSWMGRGEHAREFTAMITAVRKWAETQKGWDHPLKQIKDALLKKASGRVFQTDTDLAAMGPSSGSPDADWAAFVSRASGNRLYFEYRVSGEG